MGLCKLNDPGHAGDRPHGPIDGPGKWVWGQPGGAQTHPREEVVSPREPRGPPSPGAPLTEHLSPLPLAPVDDLRLRSPPAGFLTQHDPIGLAGGLNLYGFAAGDPVNFTDSVWVVPVAKTAALWQEERLHCMAYHTP